MNAMGDVLPYRPPTAKEENTAWLGMVVFLASWAMLFASVFFAYGFVRSRLSTWPPEGLPELPRAWPLLNTAILASSSLLAQLAVRAARRGSMRAVGAMVLGTVGLGTAFLVSQALLWKSLAASGLHVESGGPYASVFYGLTWLHAAHVVVGLGGLLLVSVRAFKGTYSAARYLPVRLWTAYWHFVGVVWGVMFVTVFLV